MNAPITDDALMLAAQAGDTGAFSLLVRRHQAAVRRFCLSLLRDQALSDDVAQDVVVRVWNARRRFVAQDRFKPFLFTVAGNACRRARYRQRLRALFVPEQRELAPTPLDTMAQAQTEQLVARACQQLPEKFRVPLLLRYVEQMPYDHIAQVIGLTESAARSRIHYGLKALSALLPEELAP